ncbi:hypothetical protein [Streptomyces sp. CBMA123]|uniref:hypothetical protein n=1 Tax=Streptomyces sp. CBMA123 TaxID=1896313 RepID=UPI001661A987|nr:hypothetical protein [Streptomyces sp. CBMA123]MBD0693059.1 hypothetical protein [Streptomyces sp. CBMA123]
MASFRWRIDLIVTTPGLADGCIAAYVERADYFTATAVGRIVDATLRSIDDFAAGRTNENILAPDAPKA